jgi:hypothetical protein
MKHILRSLWCLSLLGGFVFSALAADQTWEGQISDSLCGNSHDKMIAVKYPDLQTSSGAPKQDCTLACVKGGARYVFVLKGKVYKIANQNIGELPRYAANTVQLTGNMQGDTITVSKIAPSAEK